MCCLQVTLKVLGHMQAEGKKEMEKDIPCKWKPNESKGSYISYIYNKRKQTFSKNYNMIQRKSVYNDKRVTPTR